MVEERDIPDVSDMSIDDEESSGDEAAELTASLLAQLRSTIDQQHNRATFACGGAIPITKPEPSSRPRNPLGQDQDSRKLTSTPATIRWDPTGPDVPATRSKITFPLETSTEENLQRLVQDAAPATFGLKGEDVYDETYRKALKMEPTAFTTNFNPYELGIIDTIAQLLLPSRVDSKIQRSVRAELYKMNIYSGPSGKFKPHVDTPRSNTQFGSLVVCLPVEHEGGQLQVRHKDKEMTFDWSTQRDEPDHAYIRWAAFYSDCEHEVLEVVSGYRITLTYNLYAVRGNGFLAGRSPALDPSHLPLYQFVESMLREQNFMPDGGYLGFFCTHAYPHANADHTIFPDALKGLDMVLWETFNSLDLTVELRPVVKYSERADDEDEEEEEDRPVALLGTDFEVYLTDSVVGFGKTEDDVLKEWGDRRKPVLDVEYGDVHWLTRPRHQELQLVYVAYGNEPSVGAEYSDCAIVVEVPAFGKRAGEE